MLLIVIDRAKRILAGETLVLLNKARGFENFWQVTLTKSRNS